MLNERGVKFMLSNSSTEFIREQYSDYHITTVQAKGQSTQLQANVEMLTR